MSWSLRKDADSLDQTREDLRRSSLEAIGNITDLPTLPSIATRVIGMANNPDITINELKKTIMVDPPLAAKIIKTAGSVYFGRRVPPKTLEQAIVTMGLQNLIVICNGVGFFSSLDVWKSHNLDRSIIWKHSLATGLLAKSFELRKSSSSKFVIDTFLAGLLHNIGWLVMDHLFPDVVGGLLYLAETEEHWDLEFEREHLGIDHAEIGALFLKKWGFKDSFCDVVRYHHSPDSSGRLAFFSSLIEISATLTEHQTPLEIGFESVSNNFPHQLKSIQGEMAIIEMRQRYDKYISQADSLTNHLIGWL